MLPSRFCTLLANVLFVFSLCCECRQYYHNHTLYRGIPVSQAHLQFFKNLTKIYMVNFWRAPTNLFMPVEFTLSPVDKTMFMQDIEKEEIYLTTLIDDVQRAFDKQKTKKYVRFRPATFSWSHYHDLDDINHWLSDLAFKDPEELNLMSIGSTTEGRDIIVLEINKKSVDSPSVIVEAGIHGRDWLTTAFVTYLIHNLVNAKEIGNEKVLNVVSKYRWYLIPVANPDGFNYTHTGDRLWRKNRNNEYTADLNSNFNLSFGQFGTSKNPDDEFYCGPHPFSEPETKALEQFIRLNSRTLKFYFSFHAYGEKIILPLDDSEKHLPDHNVVEKHARESASVFCKQHGCKFDVGTHFDIFGSLKSGTSSSWVKKEFKTPYVFTIYVRDDGPSGFTLPHEQLEASCQDTLNGFLHLMSIDKEKIIKKKRSRRDINETYTFGDAASDGDHMKISFPFFILTIAALII